MQQTEDPRNEILAKGRNAYLVVLLYMTKIGMMQYGGDPPKEKYGEIARMALSQWDKEVKVASAKGTVDFTEEEYAAAVLIAMKRVPSWRDAIEYAERNSGVA